MGYSKGHVMTRKFDGHELLIATHNAGKATEFQKILGDKITVKIADDVDMPDVDETGTTYAENARLKAVAGARHSNLPTMGDDSGVEIDALDGRPGLYTKRFMQQHANAQETFDVLHAEVGDRSRVMRFMCALCLAWPDGHVEEVQVEVIGQFIYPPRGENGFGFDPVFMRDGDDQVFGELSPYEKNSRSHRGKVIAAMLRKCFS